MAKVKLNLSTGAVVEKPIVTCFNVDNKSYLILDAENIGSMGLPIILVCKIENEKVVKITDAAEWQQAKDYLKGIIAGNTMSYIPVSAEMAADEVYYTQLTLPVASFDVIKNAYKVEDGSINSVEPVVPVVESTPVVEPVIPDINPVAPVMPETPVVEESPVIDIAMPTEPVETAPVIDAPVVPEVPVNDPVIPVAEGNASGIDFAESKEAFMKACENMFDALVSKFQAELDSKK